MRIKSEGDCVTIADVQRALQPWYKARVLVNFDGKQIEYFGWVPNDWTAFDNFFMELENGKILWITGKATIIVEEE